MILAPRLALFLLLAGLCIFHAQGMSVPVDCCEATRDTPVSPHLLRWFKGYEIQGTDRGCRIKALVFITIRNRKLCYSLDSSVAIGLKKSLDDRKARNKGKMHRRLEVAEVDPINVESQ